MNVRSTILEIATTKYETDRELVSSAMDSLQTLCGVKEGFLISKPMERFGWAFFKVLIKAELFAAMQLKLAHSIATSEGKKYEEKFINYITKFFENKGAKVKVKLIED